LSFKDPPCPDENSFCLAELKWIPFPLTSNNSLAALLNSREPTRKDVWLLGGMENRGVFFFKKKQVF